jgi:YHS domain-containing protein
MRFVNFAALLVLTLGVSGCAADGSSAAPSTQPHAECLVCKMNVDLACIDVPVDQKTPTYLYNGQTYYFCSDDCRSQFMKHPEKYIAMKQ